MRKQLHKIISYREDRTEHHTIDTEQYTETVQYFVPLGGCLIKTPAQSTCRANAKDLVQNLTLHEEVKHLMASTAHYHNDEGLNHWSLQTKSQSKSSNEEARIISNRLENPEIT